MAFCNKCGKEISDGASICEECADKSNINVTQNQFEDPLQQNLIGTTLGIIIGSIIAVFPLIISLIDDKANNGSVIFILIGSLIAICPVLIKNIKTLKNTDTDSPNNKASIKTLLTLAILTFLFFFIGFKNNSTLAIIISALIPIISVIIYHVVFNIKAKWLKKASLVLLCIFIVPFTIKTAYYKNKEKEQIEQAEKEAEKIAELEAEAELIAEQLEEMNKKAQTVSSIFSDYSDKYMPDGIGVKAVCTNINSDYNISEISKKINEEVGGCWLITYTILAEKDLSERETVVCYWAEDENNEFVGSWGTGGKIKITEGGIKSIFENSEAKFITSDEWDKEYEVKWEEEHAIYIENELSKLRAQRFTNNRWLRDICWSSDNIIGEFESYYSEYYDVSDLNVDIKDGQIIISGTIENKIDFRRELTIYIAVYNAAGEEKDRFSCNVGEVAGKSSREFQFGGTPNCIDELYYYQLLYVIDSK